MAIAVCVPTHNEDSAVLQSVIAQIRAVIGVDGHICAYNDKRGGGKGFALREALKAAKVYNPDLYIFIDGDGDIDPRYINSILFLLKRYDVVVGRKQLPKRWDRKVLTWASRIWIWLLFGIGVDTQTGIKGFRYKPEWELEGWAFDIEVLYKAKKMGKTIRQVPIYATVSGSKSLWDIVTTFIDTIKLRVRL